MASQFFTPLGHIHRGILAIQTTPNTRATTTLYSTRAQNLRGFFSFFGDCSSTGGCIDKVAILRPEGTPSAWSGMPSLALTPVLHRLYFWVLSVLAGLFVGLQLGTYIFVES
eukprot:SAG22_NODE_1772_length_3611_cov_11.428815_2_plen_112_part_00